MEKEIVLVRWFANESIGVRQIRSRQGRREFGSRGAAVRFVMEELEKSSRHSVRMIAEGAEFGIIDIVRMYAGRKAYRGKPYGLIQASLMPP